MSILQANLALSDIFINLSSIWALSCACLAAKALFFSIIALKLYDWKACSWYCFSSHTLLSIPDYDSASHVPWKCLSPPGFHSSILKAVQGACYAVESCWVATEILCIAVFTFNLGLDDILSYLPLPCLNQKRYPQNCYLNIKLHCTTSFCSGIDHFEWQRGW